MTDRTAESDTDLDPQRFGTRWFAGRGFRQAYVREGEGGVPLLLVHGWPETKRLYWRVIAPLAAAGFDVIVPDLRGFGESGPGPDGKHDGAASSRDLHALLTEGCGHDRVVVAASDFGGVVAQDLVLRFPRLVDRLVLGNCPLPFDRTAMAGLRTRSPRESLDYHRRQGTDPDGLLAELATPDLRLRYVETFYTSRHWAHPGAFTSLQAGFHCAPFGDAERLRWSFGPYEARYDPAACSEPTLSRIGSPTRTLVLHGPSDHVVPPDFDRMAAAVFPNHVGPIVVRECGHFIPWEAPNAFIRATADFCLDLLGGS